MAVLIFSSEPDAGKGLTETLRLDQHSKDEIVFQDTEVKFWLLRVLMAMLPAQTPVEWLLHSFYNELNN